MTLVKFLYKSPFASVLTGLYACTQRGLNTKRPTLIFLFGSHETSPITWIGTCDTVLVKSREVTGRSQTPSWWGGGCAVGIQHKVLTLYCTQKLLKI
jgi:hypothetical protein